MSYDDETLPEDVRGLSIAEDGPAGQSGRSTFDPSPYMRQLRGRGGNQDYLDVKWRLLWLRREHPDAEILTEHVRIDEGMAIFKATVTVPTGGKATGYGSETAGDFGDFIEKAETKAIGRALNALGYGAQFSEKGEEDAGSPPPVRRHSPAPAPASPDRGASASRTPYQADPRPAAQSVSAPRAAQSTAPSPATRPAERPQPTPAQPVQPAQPVASAQAASPAGAAQPATRPAPAAREVREAQPARDEPVPIRPAAPAPAAPAHRSSAAGDRPAPAKTPEADDDDVDMADMTWTAFWEWARPLGYKGRGDIERVLGYAIDAMTPAEVRAQVRAARGDD